MNVVICKHHLYSQHYEQNLKWAHYNVLKYNLFWKICLVYNREILGRNTSLKYISVTNTNVKCMNLEIITFNNGKVREVYLLWTKQSRLSFQYKIFCKMPLKPYNLNKQKLWNCIFILCMHEFNSPFREIIHAFQLKTVKRILHFFLQNVGCVYEIQKIGTIQNWCLTRNVTIYLSYERWIYVWRICWNDTSIFDMNAMTLNNHIFKMK